MIRKREHSAHGFDWCSKRNKRKTSGSQTPGSQKTLSCQATIIDRYCSKRSRSYKSNFYKSWAPFYKAGNARVPIGR